jgi:hypothetical protein
MTSAYHPTQSFGSIQSTAVKDLTDHQFTSATAHQEVLNESMNRRIAGAGAASVGNRPKGFIAYCTLGCTLLAIAIGFLIWGIYKCHGTSRDRVQGQVTNAVCVYDATSKLWNCELIVKMPDESECNLKHHQCRSNYSQGTNVDVMVNNEKHILDDYHRQDETNTLASVLLFAVAVALIFIGVMVLLRCRRA